MTSTHSPLALLLLLAACARAPEAAPGVPLLDGDAFPDVLVEVREIAPPPATDGNRFLSGWRPARAATAAARRGSLAPGPAGARLEAVALGGSPRHLVLAMAPGTRLEGSVAVRIAGRPEVSLPLASRVAVALPGDLPLGRFPIDLRFPAGPAVVQAAGFDRALPAGTVEVAGGRVRQGGVSLVELVRPLAGAGRLVGELLPPPHPRPGQRFEIRQHRPGGDRLLWRWEPSFWSRLRRPRRLDLPVEGVDGWLRLRLFAATPGPAGTWTRLRLHHAMAPPAPVPPTPPPPRLVVLYVLDALRADAVGPQPNGSATPVLDRLATAGARFSNHFAVAPNTLPSTKTLLTGRVWRQRGGTALAPGQGTTLGERFRAAGYRTGLFSGNVHVSHAYGLDRGFEVAPETIHFGRRAAGERPPAYNDNAERVHDAALGWLSSLPAPGRAFLYVHVVHPHNPYDPPPPFRSRFDDSRDAQLDGSTESLHSLVHQRVVASDQDQRRIRGLYRGGLAYADAELGRFLAELASRYPRGDVLVAVTSDHGEELFDHGGLLHGYTLYDEMLRIPLVLWWPGRVAPQTITRASDTRALHLALAALAEGAGRGVGSLWSLLRPHSRAVDGKVSDEPRFAAAASLKGGIFMARSARYKVIWAPRRGMHWGMGEGLGRSRDGEYVFDLQADPGELRNLAGIDQPEVVWLRSRLLAWARQPEPEEAPSTQPDAATREQLRALGYVD